MLDNFSIWIFATKMTQNSRTLIWNRVDCPIFFFECQTSLVFVAFLIHSLYLFISFFPYVQHYWKVFISSASNIELQERDKFVAKVEKPSKSYKMWNNAKKSNRHLHRVWKSCQKVLFYNICERSELLFEFSCQKSSNWILAENSNETIFANFQTLCTKHKIRPVLNSF